MKIKEMDKGTKIKFAIAIFLSIVLFFGCLEDVLRWVGHENEKLSNILDIVYHVVTGVVILVWLVFWDGISIEIIKDKKKKDK